MHWAPFFKGCRNNVQRPREMMNRGTQSKAHAMKAGLFLCRSGDGLHNESTPRGIRIVKIPRQALVVVLPASDLRLIFPRIHVPLLSLLDDILIRNIFNVKNGNY